jgi:agmatine/peptidylarginine deiminase
MKQRRLPSEWEEQSGVMLTWPHKQGDWKSNFDEAEKTFLNIAKQISMHELVLIVCENEKQRTEIQAKLNQCDVNPDKLRFSTAPSNDTWSRDHGPITVFERETPLLLDFIFNGWGNKYPSEFDNKISRQLQSKKIFGDTQMESINFILEGGSLDTDGNGTMLTTRKCLLNPSRNKNFNQQEIEKTLIKHLGIDRVLWLGHGELSGDDTDSHIDTLARFCDGSTIAYVKCDNHKDEHYENLTAMHEELLQFKDKENQPYKLVPLPLPSAKFNKEGKRLPATYANFLIINGAVLVPTYEDDMDEIALKTLQSCFINRRIININCSALIEQFGSLHCVTMQFPKNVLT